LHRFKIRKSNDYVDARGHKSIRRCDCTETTTQTGSGMCEDYTDEDNSAINMDVEGDLFANLPSVEDVRERINERYDKLYHVNADGIATPHVCSVCDEFILHENDLHWLPLKILEAHKKLLTWEEVLQSNQRISEVEEYYRLSVDEDEVRIASDWLNKLALSPRANWGRKSSHGRSKWGISCCTICQHSIRQTKCTPLYAIVNANHVGGAPKCIAELTEVERVFVTPGKGYGYCFSYIGGTQKNLKGTLTFMRVEERKVARAAIHLEQMGLNKHVVVLLSGKMTAAQRSKALQKQVIRSDKVLAAIEWLCKNHKMWKGVNLDGYRDALDGVMPVVVDKSKEVDSENSNVETHELFSCYFPDGATDEHSGGFENKAAFKEYVDEKVRNNFDVELCLDLEKEYMKKGDGDLLVSACLLQFPYGIGGMDETRRKQDGSYSDYVELEPYLEHISKMSNPTFQEPMVQLITYSLISKQRLLRRARLQTKGKHDIESLANGLVASDVTTACRERAAGNRQAGTKSSKKLLSAVDACSRALPHTNEAARSARCRAEAMQHYYGIGGIWATVTFDDDNCWLVQVYTGERIDDDTAVDELHDSTLKDRTTKRKLLRLKYPGVAGLTFEMLLHVVAEEVFGWNLRTNKAMEKPGFFGECYALAIAIEEQGRKTLHAHITAWIRRLSSLRRTMFFAEREETREAAKQKLLAYHDRVSSTSLLADDCVGGGRGIRKLKNAWDHECSVPIAQRQMPVVVNDQGLRDLRHKKGFQATDGLYAYCFHCEESWTYEQLLGAWLKSDRALDPNNIGGTDPDGATLNSAEVSRGKFADIPKERMLAKIVEYQKRRDADEAETPSNYINAVYQHHVSCHVRGCFKCNKQNKATHTCGPNCECRYRLPDRARRTPEVRTVMEGKSWFTWNGEERRQPLVEFLPKRCQYDLFQNVSCGVISESKLSCNSNVALITDGPVSQYMFKYQHKETNTDDTAEYSEVDKSIKSMHGRAHADDRAEAIRVICRGAFANNKKNVVAAPMCNWLTRHKTGRFFLSHKTTYCPLRDLMRIHLEKNVEGLARYTQDGNVYFENLALHYLCRPDDHERMSLKEFFEGCEFISVVGNKKRKRGDDVIPFKNNTGFFKHPSATRLKNGRLGTAKQGVRVKVEQSLIQVSQWLFPDSSKFQCDILYCETEQMTLKMEEYSQAVLTLLLPHRHKGDFLPENDPDKPYPYTRKLQEVARDDLLSEEVRNEEPILFSAENEAFLQNIQDAAYNSMRYKLKGDDLQSCTVPLQSGDMHYNDDNRDDEEEEEGGETPYEELLNYFEEESEGDLTDKNPAFIPTVLQGFNFRELRNRGEKGCGFNKKLPKATFIRVQQSDGTTTDFVHYTRLNTTDAPARNKDPLKERKDHPMEELVEVLFSRKEARARGKQFPHNPDKEVEHANGTFGSILSWAEAAQLDTYQKRSFEVIIAAFLLTFFNVEDEDSPQDSAVRRKFRRSRQILRRLKGGSNDQLICLLHGPGGSGKSTVINLVTAYAKEFCEAMDHPFTTRTIVVTAMSGVAATLLHGETAHSAMDLNKRRPTQETQDSFQDARLVIIDEISFAAESDHEHIYCHLQTIMDDIYKPYGGMNLLMAGDYSQLEPPKRTPIYDGEPSPYFHSQLNAYIELDGKWRFIDDPEWGEKMLRFRNGEPLIEDIWTINDNCLVTDDHVPPANIQVATHKNKDRDAVNTAVFEEFCAGNCPQDGSVFNDAIVVFMDELQMKDGKTRFVAVQSNIVKKHFWSYCGEDSCKPAGMKDFRSDPVLKLYPDCPLMLPINQDVLSGQANGSRLLLKKVNVKVGETHFELHMKCGQDGGAEPKIRAFFASQLESLEVEHECKDIYPRQFTVTSEVTTFDADLRVDGEKVTVRMKGRQFPLISNTATTGHKLQGYTAKKLLSVCWFYASNWTYVVLSRVRTMAGMYMLQPLTEELTKYAMPQKMKDMMRSFRDTILVAPLSENEYKDLERMEMHIQE